MLDADIPYIMELAQSDLDRTKDSLRLAAIDSVRAGIMRQSTQCKTEYCGIARKGNTLV